MFAYNQIFLIIDAS